MSNESTTTTTMDIVKENDHLKTTMERLTQENQRLEKEITDWTDKFEKSNKKCEKLQAAWGDFISEKSALEDDLEVKSNEVKELKKKLEESDKVRDSTIQKLSDDNLELTKRIQEQDKQMVMYEEKLRKLQICVKKQNDNIADLNDKLRKAEQMSAKTLKDIATQTEEKSCSDKLLTANGEEQNSRGSFVDYEMKRWQSKVDHQIEDLNKRVEFLTAENLKLQLQHLVAPSPPDNDARKNMQLFIPNYPHNLNLNSMGTSTAINTTAFNNIDNKNPHHSSSSLPNHNSMYTNNATFHHSSHHHEMEEIPRKLNSSCSNNNLKSSASSSISGKTLDVFPVKNSSIIDNNNFDMNKSNGLNQMHSGARNLYSGINQKPNYSNNTNNNNNNSNSYYSDNHKSSQQKYGGKQHQQRPQKHHKTNHLQLKRCNSDALYKPQPVKLTSISPLLQPPIKLVDSSSSSSPPPPLPLVSNQKQEHQQQKAAVVNSTLVFNQIASNYKSSQPQEQSQRPISRNSHNAESTELPPFIPLQTMKANVRQNMEVHKSQNNLHINSSNNVIKPVKEVQSTSVSPPPVQQHELSASGQKIFELYHKTKRFESIDAVENIPTEQNSNHKNYQHTFQVQVGQRKFPVKVWLTMRIAGNGISQPEFFKMCFPSVSMNSAENGSNPWSYGNCFIKLTFLDHQPLIVCSKTFQVSAMNGTCENMEKLEPHWDLATGCDMATLSLNKKDFDEFFVPGLESYKITKEEESVGRTALIKSKRAIKSPHKKDDPFFLADVELFLMYGTTKPGYSLESTIQKITTSLKFNHTKCPKIYFEIDEQSDRDSYYADPCYIKEYAPVLSALLRDSYVENGRIIENEDGSKTIYLPGVSKSTICTFLKFIQGELIKTDEIKELLELLEFSHKYLIVNLAIDCVDKLKKSQKYNLTHALECCAQGYKLNIPELSETGKSYIETHGEELASEEGTRIYEEFMSTKDESFFEL